MPAAAAHLVTLIETYHALKSMFEAKSVKEKNLLNSIFTAEPVKERKLITIPDEEPKPLGRDKTDQYISQYAYLGSVFPDVPYFGGEEVKFAADLFHYNKSGTLAIKLIDYARGRGVESKSGNRLMAFTLGFISHIACDVVCHPYINTIAGAYFNQRITYIDTIKLPIVAEIPAIGPLIRYIANKKVNMHMMTETHQDSWLAKEYFGLKDLSSEGASRSWSGFIDELSLGLAQLLGTKLRLDRVGLVPRKDEVEELFADVCSCFTKVYGTKLEERPLWIGSYVVFEMLDGSYDRAIFPYPDEASMNLVNYVYRDHNYWDYLKRAFTLSKVLCKLAIDYYNAPELGTSEKDTLKEYLKDWNLDTGYHINVKTEKKNGKIESINIRYEHSWCHNYGLYKLGAEVTEKKEDILPAPCRKESIKWSNVYKEVAGQQSILSQSDSMSALMSRIHQKRGNLDILSSELESTDGELGRTGRSPRDLKNQGLVCFQFAWSKIESRFHMASIMAHEYEHARQVIDRKFVTAEAAPFLTSREYIVLKWSSEYKAFDFQAKVLKEILEAMPVFKPCYEALLARDRRLSLLTEGKVNEARSEIINDYSAWRLGGEQANYSEDKEAVKFVKADVENFKKSDELKKEETIWKPYLPW